MPRQLPRSPQASLARRQRLLSAIFVVVLVAGTLFFSGLLYTSVRDLVTYANWPRVPANLPNLAHPRDPAHADAEAPLTDRINVLLVGIDRRENEKGPWRTDTMILLSLDPISNTASMLSIPRDLWVEMPGYDMKDRINAAAVWGENHAYPGGGLEYAKQAVQHNLGVPVNHYVCIDFAAFQKVIDTIGGIDIDVPEEIVDPAYPTEDYGTMRLVIPAGRQHMNGDLALKYTRTRHTTLGGDIGRLRRQQQVILAALDRALRLSFPISRVPGLLQTVGDSVQTDASLNRLLALCRAVPQLQAKGIRQGVIDETMVSDWMTPDGKMVLVPDRDKIRKLVAELFPVSGQRAANTTLGEPVAMAKPLPSD